jgi:hypothetical protein
MTASDYQRLAQAKLKRHFVDVRTQISGKGCALGVKCRAVG